MQFIITSVVNFMHRLFASKTEVHDMRHALARMSNNFHGYINPGPKHPFKVEAWIQLWPTLLEAPPSQMKPAALAKLAAFDVTNASPLEVYDFLDTFAEIEYFEGTITSFVRSLLEVSVYYERPTETCAPISTSLSTSSTTVHVNPTVPESTPSESSDSSISTT